MDGIQDHYEYGNFSGDINGNGVPDYVETYSHPDD
jgi:hypothetical protein